MAKMKHFFLIGLVCCLLFAVARADDDDDDDVTLDDDIGKSREGSRTDDEAVQREEEAISLDGLSVAQMKELRDKSEKFQFQAEVNRMMKLIINSLYKNKEIFLRELISNASDALDKIRFLSLTDPNALTATDELTIKIKADKDNKVLHITDTGIGMTKDELVKNLGTIAKSGTSDFLSKLNEANSATETNDLIGQFGVGFYSAFLVADRVIVTSKHNDDEQYIWESDAESFSVIKDPRGSTLGRGTTISLQLKEEAHDYLEETTLKNLVKKYSQFINFNIYLWTSQEQEVDEPVEEEEEAKSSTTSDDDEDEAKVEEEEESSEKAKTKKVKKTVWDWELMNSVKPIWTRKAADVTDEEYNAFYKSISKESSEPMAKIHFTAEGEVTFKSILFVPSSAPYDTFTNYGKKVDHIKATYTNSQMYVRRVFITDNFEDMMPKYLSFIRGVVDSDDLPLNVSRETLQQHKLLKVIKKKLVRKALDMIKKIDKAEYEKFWKEFSTNIKLGVIEDTSNRTRLAKLLRFYSSNSDTEQTFLADYVERMKEKQEAIYFIAGTSREEVEKSPFVERLLKKGYEVLYLVEPVDEYCIQSLPEFEGKKFQNIAKEGLNLDTSEKAKERKEAIEKEFKPLTDWLKENALKDQIEKATISERLTNSPCALVASQYGWSGNMERIMKSQAYAKQGDASNQFYANQKKTLEINTRHPLIKELKARIEADNEDETAKDLAKVLFDTATLRSGFSVKDSLDFAQRIERMMKMSMGIDLNAPIEDEPEEEEVAGGSAAEAEEDEEISADPSEDKTDDEKQESCAFCNRKLMSADSFVKESGVSHNEDNKGGDTDGDGTPDHLDFDDDNDGVPDSEDADDDGDGIPDEKEIDSDGDGIVDYLDNDDDNDGVLDWKEPIDTDKDGIPDDIDKDDDDDGIIDSQDKDGNGNGILDDEEGDRDNDGIPDYLDRDDDGDGIPDHLDTDDYSKKVDIEDDILETGGHQKETEPDMLEGDSDGDGIPDHLDDDDDNDGVPDSEDNDDDGDGIPDELEKDTDGDDGIPDHLDDDDDNDGIPDAEDNDDDGDGIPDEQEKDTDGDGIPDHLDDDDDNDGISDKDDNDDDGDGIPDEQEKDTDGDGIPD
ncbi:unnamed protein product, partial [Lymnaea stagnalis]